jgi:uncharacterized protein YkwD
MWPARVHVGYASVGMVLAVFAATTLLFVAAVRDGTPSRYVNHLGPSDIMYFPGASTTEHDASAEKELFRQVNQFRQSRGLPILKESLTLQLVAERHSKDMYVRGFLGHVTPDGRTLSDRLRTGLVSYTAVAENLAIAPTAADAFLQFLDSPDHRRHLLDPRYCEMGVGTMSGPRGLVVTMLFIVDRPYGTPPSAGCS